MISVLAAFRVGTDAAAENSIMIITLVLVVAAAIATAIKHFTARRNAKKE